jgi:hypothetical protein
MKLPSWSSLILAFLVLVLASFNAFVLPAQTRLSDKDVQQHMKNLNQDTKIFRSTFNSSVSKTSIRKTTQEKDAKSLVQNFQTETKSMYEHFKKSRKSDPYLQNCLGTAGQIDKLLKTTQFDAATTSQWVKVKSQLYDLATAFHLPGY